MLKPTIHRVLVKPDDVDKQTKSGLHIPEETQERLQVASTMGTIVAQGETAWKDYKVTPETKVGDRVGFARYAGNEFEHDGVKYRLLNDEDILVVIRNEGDSE